MAAAWGFALLQGFCAKQAGQFFHSQVCESSASSTKASGDGDSAPFDQLRSQIRGCVVGAGVAAVVIWESGCGR